MHPDTVKLFGFCGVSVALSAFFFLTAPTAPKWLEAMMGGHHGEHHEEAHTDAHATHDAHAAESHAEHSDHATEESHADEHHAEDAVAKVEAKDPKQLAAEKAAAAKAKEEAEKHQKHIGVATAMWRFLGIATALAGLLSLLIGIWTAVRLDKMRGDEHAAAH